MDNGIPTNNATRAASPQPVGVPPEELTFRVHNSYIWLESLKVFFIILFVMVVSGIGSVASILEEGMGNDGFVFGLLGFGFLMFVVVIAGLCFLLQWLSYRNLSYSIGASEFSLNKGIFNKQHVHIPYTRIQSVDKRATLLQRVFGVCSLNIDTAGGASNKAVVVPYVTKAQADWVIAQIYARKNAEASSYAEGMVDSQLQGGQQAPAYGQQTPTQGHGIAQGQPMQPATQIQTPASAQPAVQAQTAQTGNIFDVGERAWNDFGGVFAGASSPNAPYSDAVKYQYGLSNKELFLSGLSNNTAFAAIVISVVCAICEIVGFLGDAFTDEAENAIGGLAQLASSAAVPVFAGAAFFVIVVLVIIWLISAIGTCINYGGFHARRYADRIEVEHGLLQHTSMSVSIDRIQAVVVKQTFIRRLIGYCELSLNKVDAVANNSDSNQNKSLNTNGLVIHPFVKKSRVSEILASILPEYSEAPSQDEDIKVAPKALRRAITRRALWQGGGFYLILATVIFQLIMHAVLFPQGAPLYSDVLAEGLYGADSLSAADAQGIVGAAYAYIENATYIWMVDMGCTILYVIGVLIIAIDVIAAVLWYRNSSFAYNRHFMRITNGGLSSETSTLKKQKIQYGFTKTNPLQRLAKTATIKISTAAGAGTQSQLIDIHEQDAARWLDWLKPKS